MRFEQIAAGDARGILQEKNLKQRIVKMRKTSIVSLLLLLLGAVSLYAQYPSVTIAQIQQVPLGQDSSTFCGDTIHVCGIITGGTGLYYAGSGVSFYMEMAEGGPWSGIMAYNASAEGFPTLIPGDSICFDALVDEYFWSDPSVSRFTSNMTELFIVPGTFVFGGFGHPEPTPVTITADVIDSTDGGDTLAEQYEGVYCRVNNITVDTVIIYTNTSEWVCHDSAGNHLMVREASDSINFLPSPGMTFAYVQGVIYDRFGGYHLQPRYIRDIQLPVGGPIISNVTHNPPYPINAGSGDADSVIVRANVVGPDSVTNVWIYYRFNLGSWQSTSMTAAPNYFYTFTFPPMPAGYRVDYYIRARDIDGDTSKYPDQAPISFLGFAFQSPTPMTIAQARVDADHDFLPDLANDAVLLTGVASSGNFSTTQTNFFMQSEGAGINVYYSGGLLNINIGDSIRASGIVGQYNGRTQLQVYKASRISVLGSGAHLDTVNIYCSALKDSVGEALEGLLAMVPSVAVIDSPDTWPNIGYSATMTIQDHTYTGMLRIESSTNIPGQIRPDTMQQIVGILGQYDTSPPYTSGYQLQPRMYTDFQDATVAPPQCEYLIGDISGDGQRLGGDVTYGVRFFKGIGSVPRDSCFMDSTGTWLYVAGDCNGNCEFRGSDITRLVAYFKGNAALNCCHFFPTTLPRIMPASGTESIKVPTKSIESQSPVSTQQIESPQGIRLQRK
jgi:hypothetical protein